jgi:hypothetical protein
MKKVIQHMILSGGNAVLLQIIAGATEQREPKVIKERWAVGKMKETSIRRFLCQWRSCSC